MVRCSLRGHHAPVVLYAVQVSQQGPRQQLFVDRPMPLLGPARGMHRSEHDAWQGDYQDNHLQQVCCRRDDVTSREFEELSWQDRQG